MVIGVHRTGLGLSISYTLAARHGGSISVASEPGKGAHFTVSLSSEPQFQQPPA